MCRGRGERHQRLARILDAAARISFRVRNLSVPDVLRIGGVPEHFNLPWHLAIESGAAAPGLLRWRDYTSGTGAMLADLVHGSIDLAVLLTEGAALGIARGLPIVPVSLYTQSPLIWGVHTAPGSRFGSISALRGARFAISRAGSGSHLMCLAMALAQGWPVEEQRLVVIHDLKGAIAAFRDGEADAFLWERFTTEPEVAAGTMQRIGEFVAPWPAWVLCVRSVVWNERRTAVMEAFARVTGAAARLSADPAAASRIAARYGLREDAVAAWLERTEWVQGPVPPEAALGAARAMLEAAGAIASA